MPEPYWPKRRKFLISEAMKHSRYAAIRCPFCKRQRYFLLADLQRIFGDIDCDAITYENRWRCSGCNGTMHLDFRLQSQAAPGTIIMRLESISYTPRIVWREEKL